MTDEQRRIVMHSLGLNQRGRSQGYRNYYASAPTDDLEAMREAGWMTRRDPTSWMPDHLYFVTKRGLTAAGLTESHVDSETAGRMPA